MSKSANETELVALRVPVPELREIRIAAHAETDGNTSEMIRRLCREGLERRAGRRSAA
jgi:hypothetical protein